MKYRKKSDVIEAVKWDGKLETIENNKWLEDAIKEDKIILGMNDIYDKEPVLLIENKWSEEFRQVDLGTYLIKEYDKTNEDYVIRVMDSEDFERTFELINDSLSEVSKESINIKVDLDVEEVMKSISKLKEEVIGCTKLCKSRNIDAVNEILIMQSNCKIPEALERLEQVLSKKIGKKVVILPNYLNIIDTIVNK